MHKCRSECDRCGIPYLEVEIGRGGENGVVGWCVGDGVADYFADFEGAGLVEDEHSGVGLEFRGRFDAGDNAQAVVLWCLDRAVGCFCARG